MLVLLIGIAVATFFFYFYIARKFNFWKKQGVEQGKPAFLFGHNFGAFFRLNSNAEMVQTVYNQSPAKRYTGMYSFHLPILVIRDPELLKQLTVKVFDHIADHIAFLPEGSDPLWSSNLLSLRGQRWRDMRAILSPSFTGSKMKMMFSLMEECVLNTVQHFLKKEEDVITVEMKDVTTRLANDVIATTAFGVTVDSSAEPNNEFYLMGKKAVDISNFWKNLKMILHLIFPPIKHVLKIQLFTDEVSNFFRRLIDETIKTREEKGIVRPDMIHLLMEARKGTQNTEENVVADTGFATAEDFVLTKEKSPKIALTNLDITAQAAVFFFAGFESVSGLASFSTYELAVHPDIQERLRKEIQTTMAECNGKLTYEALSKMKYMDMVVSETLRKWPNFVALDRVCSKPYVIEATTPDEKPLYVEKGTAIWLPVFAIHRDPQYYPDPDRFDPERFNDENKSTIKPFTYFPFGLGPRNCIGSRFALMEAKLFIFHFLLHFELVPVEKTPIPFKICKKNFSLNSEDGFWLGLKKIK